MSKPEPSAKTDGDAAAAAAAEAKAAFDNRAYCMRVCEMASRRLADRKAVLAATNAAFDAPHDRHPDTAKCTGCDRVRTRELLSCMKETIAAYAALIRAVDEWKTAYERTTRVAPEHVPQDHVTAVWKSTAVVMDAARTEAERHMCNLQYRMLILSVLSFGVSDAPDGSSDPDDGTSDGDGACDTDNK